MYCVGVLEDGRRVRPMRKCSQKLDLPFNLIQSPLYSLEAIYGHSDRSGRGGRGRRDGLSVCRIVEPIGYLNRLGWSKRVWLVGRPGQSVETTLEYT